MHAWAFPYASPEADGKAALAMGVFGGGGVGPTRPEDLPFRRTRPLQVSVHAGGGGMCCSPNNARLQVDVAACPLPWAWVVSCEVDVPHPRACVSLMMLPHKATPAGREVRSTLLGAVGASETVGEWIQRVAHLAERSADQQGGLTALEALQVALGLREERRGDGDGRGAGWTEPHAHPGLHPTAGPHEATGPPQGSRAEGGEAGEGEGEGEGAERDVAQAWWAQCVANAAPLGATGVRRLSMERDKKVPLLPEGCSASPVHAENLGHWRVVLRGPVGSPYEGGHFVCELLYPSDYPFRPPELYVVTPLFHPLVGPDGRAELSACAWSPACNVERLTARLLDALARPQEHFVNSINLEVSAKCAEGVEAFQLTACEWTQLHAADNVDIEVSIGAELDADIARVASGG